MFWWTVLSGALGFINKSLKCVAEGLASSRRVRSTGDMTTRGMMNIDTNFTDLTLQWTKLRTNQLAIYERR